MKLIAEMEFGYSGVLPNGGSINCTNGQYADMANCEGSPEEIGKLRSAMEQSARQSLLDGLRVAEADSDTLYHTGCLIHVISFSFQFI